MVILICMSFLPNAGTEAIGGLTFVLRSEDRTRWYKDPNGQNFYIPIPGRSGKADNGPEASNELLRLICEAENSSAWTLMHRFNRAASLINEV